MADHKDVLPYTHAAMPLFLQGAPLEHLRFRRGLVREDLDDARWQGLCDETWLIDSRCEMQRVLDLYTLQPHVRDGLRVLLLLLERFGAQSVLRRWPSVARRELLSRVERTISCSWRRPTATSR